MLIAVAFTLILVGGLWFYMIQMPNVSFQGKAPPLNPDEREVLDNLKTHIAFLANDLGGRNQDNSLTTSKNHIIELFRSYGYQVSLQKYQVLDQTYTNIEVELRGQKKPEEIIIIGAHYDSVVGSPGANDNGSGVAGTLEIARRLSGQALSRTIRFVAFVNEEPPFFKTEAMGSLVYANRSAEKGEKIVGMMTLETIGYFREEPGSQHYPALINFFYPDKGNFIAFVGNLSSRRLLREAIDIFRKHATIPSEGAVLPAWIQGVDWSDHWSFWENGYPAIMITDTAPYRYPYYHTAQDTPDKIDYKKMTRVVLSVQKMLEVLASQGKP
ncbi:aminopeptidase [Candidatus Thiomargarita nelsonii]|uniref:Aminopeptidase n=1 Tax=Candidatus Thiomargarita nelsonii TaxID=1003181 RepID=A0A0A6P466_9GAMM|nr:aminopeptidase [Candidatus Thiomargarita nelsonii]